MIKNLSDSSSKGNFFDIFDNLSNVINLRIDKTYLSKSSYLKQLNGDLKVENNQIVNASILAKYSEKDKFLFSIKTSNNGEKITTLY